MAISQNSFKIDAVNSVMSNGDLVTAHLRFSAARSDQSLATAGVDLMKISNSKIQEVWLFSENQKAEDDFWSGSTSAKPESASKSTGKVETKSGLDKGELNDN